MYTVWWDPTQVGSQKYFWNLSGAIKLKIVFKCVPPTTSEGRFRACWSQFITVLDFESK